MFFSPPCPGEVVKKEHYVGYPNQTSFRGAGKMISLYLNLQLSKCKVKNWTELDHTFSFSLEYIINIHCCLVTPFFLLGFQIPELRMPERHIRVWWEPSPILSLANLLYHLWNHRLQRVRRSRSTTPLPEPCHGVAGREGVCLLWKEGNENSIHFSIFRVKLNKLSGSCVEP